MLPTIARLQAFVVGEDMDVQGHATTYGVAEWAQHSPLASGTAPTVSRAVAAGAACVAKSGMQPAGIDLVGANFGNPLNKSRVSGGGHTGAAVAVAQRRVQFAACTDALGQARVPAACCGVYAFRPSLGVFDGPDAPAAGPAGLSPSAPAPLLSAVSLVANDPALMLKLAQALGAPGKHTAWMCVIAKRMRFVNA